MLFVKLLASKEKLLLRFQVPLNERAIFRPSNDGAVIVRPLKTSNRLLMSLHKSLLSVDNVFVSLIIVLLPLGIATKLVCQLVEQLALRLESLHLQMLC